MITTGPFNQCIKTGMFFSLGTDDRVFTGDLFYNFATREFQIRGIPCFEGQMVHVLPKTERGPIALQIFVESPKEIAVRDEAGKYADLVFDTAKIAQKFLVWIEEYYHARSVVSRIYDTWNVQPNLVWIRP